MVFISEPEAAKMLGVSRATLARARKRKSNVTLKPPPYYRNGKRILYNVDDINAHMQKYRVDAINERYNSNEPLLLPKAIFSRDSGFYCNNPDERVLLLHLFTMAQQNAITVEFLGKKFDLDRGELITDFHDAEFLWGIEPKKAQKLAENLKSQGLVSSIERISPDVFKLKMSLPTEGGAA